MGEGKKGRRGGEGEGRGRQTKHNPIRQTKQNQITSRGGHDRVLLVLIVFMAASMLIVAVGAMAGDARQAA